MPSCVVKSCKNYLRKLKKSQGITYHAFPRNSDRKDNWIQIIRNCRGENDWNPSSASTVCSVHFDDDDFKKTAKGLRCLVPYAVPKRFLSSPSKIEAPSPSSVPSLFEVPVLKEESLFTGYCRLCASSDCNGMLVNLQSDDDLKKLVVNMSNRLNTNIDFNQEHLPTTICSVCIKALYTAYDFVVGIDLAQVTLYNIFNQKYKYQMPENWNHTSNLDLPTTSLQEVSIKVEEEENSDIEQPSSEPPPTIFLSEESSDIKVATSGLEQPYLSSTTRTSPEVSPNMGAGTRNLEQPPATHESSSNTPLDTSSIRHLKYNLNRKTQIVDGQKVKIKNLHQRVRRLQKRYELLKNIVKRKLNITEPYAKYQK